MIFRPMCWPRSFFRGVCLSPEGETAKILMYIIVLFKYALSLNSLTGEVLQTVSILQSELMR